MRTPILTPPASTEWATDPEMARVIGLKARGLCVIPPAWRPPFVVIEAGVFAEWVEDPSRPSAMLDAVAASIDATAMDWRAAWPRGLILRSSATDESLDDRGANASMRLAADHGPANIRDAIVNLFQSYAAREVPGQLAIVVQPLVGEGSAGHMSNERRVSPTVNQWLLESSAPEFPLRRFNSQRAAPPDASRQLDAEPDALSATFKAVGRWATLLGRGPCHMEWAHDGRTLWLLQVDLERDRPDEGVNPTAWLRQADDLPSGIVPDGSWLRTVDVAADAAPGAWRKIESVRRFAKVRSEPYPRLVSIKGDRLVEAAAADRSGLEAELEAFAHGRVVCRTDCRKEGVERENLPRTSTVGSAVAVDEMLAFLQRLRQAGADDDEVCFIAHKFIPARAGAWVRADPSSSLVRVDALWGVPDGLQYLPHDTFEVDVRRSAVSAERIRYKPRFIQECADGSWRELKVRRSLARTRAISGRDAIAISRTTHALASDAGRPLLVMWFCGIPPEVGIGANLPWFSMPPNPTPALVGEPVSPRWPRTILRSMEDLEAASTGGAARTVLVLDPELELFRDGTFVTKVIELARRDQCPVQLAGSELAHAHYQLEKAGVAVVPAERSAWNRARGRRSFGKLVRDDMPEQIAERGEVVVQSRLARSEMRRALVAKLHEEAHELLLAGDPDEVKAELADLLEVVRALADVTGVGWQDVEVSATEKRQRRGGFGEGAVLVKTEWPATGDARRREPSLVSLRSLGQVTSAPGATTASYNALLSNDAGLALTVGGADVEASLTREGLTLRALATKREAAEQMRLPFAEGDLHKTRG